jgi:hypothetical protein
MSRLLAVSAVLVVCGMVSLAAASPAPSNVASSGGDPGWRKPYEPTRLEWLVLDFNVHSTRDCPGSQLAYFGGPKNDIIIEVNITKGPFDGETRKCVAGILAHVQVVSSIAWKLRPPLVTLNVLLADRSQVFFYECLLRRLPADFRGDSTAALRLGLSIETTCHETPRK